MKPGATTMPFASMTRPAATPSMRLTAATLPPAMPTSRGNRGEPVPSTTSPPATRISNSTPLGVQLFASRLSQQLPRHAVAAGQQAAVDPEHGAGDPCRLVRSQEHRRVRDIVRLSHASERIPLDETLEDHGVAVDSFLPDGRPDRAGRDGVAADAETAIADGDALREVDHSSLGRAVSLVAESGQT